MQFLSQFAEHVNSNQQLMRFSRDLRHLWGHLDHFCCSLLDEVIWTRRAAYVENMKPEADDTLEKTHSIQLNSVLWSFEI